MGCLLILVLLGAPRIALLAVWLTMPGYLSRAFDGTLIWPILGFVFLPYTTVAFAYGMNTLGGPGVMTPLGWLLVALGLLFDLGSSGRAARHRRRRRDDN